MVFTRVGGINSDGVGSLHEDQHLLEHSGTLTLPVLEGEVW
jgi:hypothetical protein